MPPPFDPQAGMAELMEPSVPVDPWGYHMYEAQEFQSYLNSEAFRTVQADPEQQPGAQNVILYWQKVTAAAGAEMAAMQPPPQPEGAPQKPGEPKKPGISEHKPTETAEPAPQGQ